MKSIATTIWIVIAFGALKASGQSIMTTPLSVDGNGMGGAGAAVVSNNSLAPTANPAQLGIFSLTHVLNAAAYMQKPSMVPGSSYSRATLNATAANIGLDLEKFVKSPFDIGFGVGYSKESFDAGNYNFTQPGGTPITAPDGEQMETVSLGIGLDWYVDLALGYTSKRVYLHRMILKSDGIYFPFSPEATAYDWGAMLKIPVIEMVGMLTKREIMLTPKLRPVFGVTASVAQQNVGGSISSSLSAGTMPLPRQAVAGLAVNAGLTTNVEGKRWEVFSLVLARQADASLVNYSPAVLTGMDQGFYSGYSYKPGLGNLEPVDNLILGRSNGAVTIIKGWQVGVGGMLYLRGGAYYPAGQGSYNSIGGTFDLRGFVELLAAYHLVNARYGAFGFIMNHLDLEYDYSKYVSASDPALSAASFQDWNLVVK